MGHIRAVRSEEDCEGQRRMAVTEDDVRRVADLARLQLSHEEKVLLTEELNRILSYMEKLDELDTRDVEPTSHVVPVSNPLRADEAEVFPNRGEILALAPDVKNGYFRVPKIIEYAIGGSSDVAASFLWWPADLSPEITGRCKAFPRRQTQ